MFDINKEYCDLIDQYNDFINIQKSKKIEPQMTKFPVKLIMDKTITIIDKENQYDIEFTNYSNFDQINNYLRDELGQGRLRYKVD